MVFYLKSRRSIFRLSAASVILCLSLTLLLFFIVDKNKVNNSQSEHNSLKSDSDKKSLLLDVMRKQIEDQIKQINDTKFKFSHDLASPRNTKLNLEKKTTFRPAQKQIAKQVKDDSAVNYNVHVFYYPWYGNPTFDKKYLHWNHPYLLHWSKKEAKKWPTGIHTPPDDIGSNFYPELGPYSSKDPEVVRKHVQAIRSAGIGVMAVSWYPPGDADANGEELDKLMPLILDKAAENGIKVVFHIEPYKGRDHLSLRKNLAYILKTYGNHTAFYRRYHKGKKKYLPLYYIYDSYQVNSRFWAKLFKPDGQITIRDTELDGFFIGLLVEHQHKTDIFAGGFDGFYNYFATNGFTYGSSWDNWKEIQKYAATHSKIFIPSVGPGYIDTNVRPWNAKNIRNREEGKYYKRAFEAGLKINPEILSITSFNEWHEGTQIEPAVSKNTGNFLYLDYGHKGARYYLDLTREFVDRYSQM